MRVEYFRDGLIEEFHEGVCVFLNEQDISAEPYFLRSCAKPLQASLIIDSCLDFSEEELAFCSGSHAGEECHIEIAQRILKKTGLQESCLKCGIHEPLSRTMQDKMLLRAEKASVIHNNCSGKHLGFLAVCKANGWDLETYYEPSHPLQMAVKKRIYELCEVTDDNSCSEDMSCKYPLTTDGCGVPIVSMPLKNLVIGFKNLYEQYPQIVEAILKNPYIYGGENRLDTEIIQKTGMLAKVGAGGLCVVFNPKLKEGFAVKMFDASMLARRFAVFEIIKRLGWAEVEIDNKIRILNGNVVGKIQVVF